MLREDTWVVMNAMAAIPAIDQYTLVGGTAIALRAKHRISEDLDFCVTSRKLDRKAINTIVEELSKQFTVIDNTDITQKENFVNDGMDLLDYHQDWLVDNVKVTFFTIGASDAERSAIASYSRENVDGVNVLSMEGLFTTKCLALADRIKTRDIFDLWWFIDAGLFAIDDVFSVIQEFRPHTKYEDIRYRLLDWTIPSTDEGLESVTGKKFDDVRIELKAMVDTLELKMASKILLDKD